MGTDHIDKPLIWGETPLQKQIFWRSPPVRRALGMAHNPIFGSDPAKPESSASRPTEGGSDLAELAARFAVHGGGRVSPELSADLALQIVLNEIVEQACLATGAGGSAIVLERGGEWVCRASAGSIAPQLGARLDTEAGLSGACVKTRTVQRCDDAQNDTRADMEACRILGVRSVIIRPLLQRSGELAGVFEVFSSSPSAFDERDEHTLGALSERVLRNLERAAEPMAAAPGQSTGVVPAVAQDKVVSTGTSNASSFATSAVSSAGAADVERGSSDRGLAGRGSADRGPVDRSLPPAVGEVASSRGMNVLTWVLGVAVLAYAVLLTVLVTERLRGGKADARAHAAGAVSAPAGNQSAGSKASVPTPSAAVGVAGSSGAGHAGVTSPQPGGLRVYENGREVFRMPPAAEEGEATDPKGGSGSAAADGGGPSGEAAGIVEVAPGVAEGSLLHRVEPDYPEDALRQQIEGAVVLEVRAGRDGAVEEVKLLSGQPLLADAAIAAVKQWRFTPRAVEGQPVGMQTKVILNFRLPR
jgi:TonB family protein